MKHFKISSTLVLVLIYFSASSQVGHKIYINGGNSWSLDIGSVKNTEQALISISAGQNNVEFNPLKTRGTLYGIDYALTFKERWRWESGISYRGINGYHQIQQNEELDSYSINGSAWALRMGFAYDLINPSNPLSIGFGLGGLLQQAKLDHKLEMERTVNDVHEYQLNQAGFTGGTATGFYTQFYAERKLFKKLIIGALLRCEYIRHTPNLVHYNTTFETEYGSAQIEMHGPNHTSLEMSNVFAGLRLGYEL